MVPVAPDLADVGYAADVPALAAWCHRHREGLRKFLSWLSAGNSAAPQEWDNVQLVRQTCLGFLEDHGAQGVPPYVVATDRGGLTETLKLLTWTIRWCRRQMDKPHEAPSPPTPAKRRARRPRKGESDKHQLVLAALVKHHGYQLNGSVEDYTPAKTAILAQLASGENVTVSPSTVSRFFKQKFPGRGYQGYYLACVNGQIAPRLALWQGEIPERCPDLLPHESGRGEED
jgi:hypothetical protein